LRAGTIVLRCGQVGVHAERTVVGHDHSLGAALGLIVDRARPDWGYVTAVVLCLLMLERLAAALQRWGVSR
jgi:hypothetical protein